MMKRSTATILLLGTMLLLSPQARSQISPSTTVTGAGAIYGTNGTYRISGTLGQPAIGLLAANLTTTAQGFWYALPRSVASAVTDAPTTGTSLTALHASPNPFTETTQLSLRIPQAEHVSLVLYNVLGQPLRTMIDEEHPGGTFTMNLVADDMPSGRYTLRLIAGQQQQTISLVVVK